MTLRTGTRRGRLAALTAATLVGTGVALVSTGTSAQALPGVVSAAQSAARSCFAAPLGGSPGVHTTELRASATGLLQARLTGSGDWDLAVFDAGTGRVVAASAGFATNELAEGFVTQGQRLLVQSCRYDGAAASANLTTTVVATGQDAGGETNALLTVRTPAKADKQRLQQLGLDLTEHGTATTVDVVARSERDLQKLRDAGLGYTVVIPDLAARARAERADD